VIVFAGHDVNLAPRFDYCNPLEMKHNDSKVIVQVWIIIALDT